MKGLQRAVCHTPLKHWVKSCRNHAHTSQAITIHLGGVRRRKRAVWGTCNKLSVISIWTPVTNDFGWSLQPVVTLKNIQGCNLAINNTLRITKEARLFCSETLQTVCLQKLPENRKQQQNPALNSVGNNNRYAFKQQSYQHKGGGGVEVGCQEAYRCAASVETLFRAPVLVISIAAVLYLDSS